MKSYQFKAVNTAPDSENRIHSQETASKFGFRDGLVPGVTVYGYLCIPVQEHFGKKWFEQGSAKLRLLKPYFEGESVDAEATVDGETLHVEAVGPRTIVDASMAALLPLPASIQLVYYRPKISASEQSLAAGTLLSTYEATDLTTPESLLEAANKAFMASYILDPWIHTASIIQHFHVATAASVRGMIVKEYERKGHRLVDIDYSYVDNDGTISARVLHSAIWKLSPQ